MKIASEGCPLNLTEQFVNLIEEVIKTGRVDTTDGVIINFKDPEYSATDGGYHPVEIMIAANGTIQYVTDFAFIGTPPHEELVKDLDFDFSLGLFQQMGRDYPIKEGKELFQVWQDNFCSYHESGVFKVKVSPC
jgi:hypothetical protein